MSLTQNDYDVIVLGDHPCTYVAASLLAAKGSRRVLHVVIPTDRSTNRAVLLNPHLFKLDKSLSSLANQIELMPVTGVRFLCDDLGTTSEHVAAAPLAFVARMHDVSQATAAVAKRAGVTMAEPATVAVRRTDPQGVEVAIDGVVKRATVLVVGGRLPEPCCRKLGIPLSWDADVQRRLYYVELPRPEQGEAASRSTLPTPMSLDLNGSMQWAWMLSTADALHLVVEQSGNRREPKAALQHWANLLASHKFLEPTTIDPAQIECIHAPIAGALAQDGVADRTVLIGPAGGFFSASGEDIYPCVWSALHAADVVTSALKQPLLQDALDDFRSCWRTGLGMYLQGPQQNLKLLLPMVYRNSAMTARLAEAIMAGKNVIH